MGLRLRQWILALGDWFLCYLALTLALIVRTWFTLSWPFYLLSVLIFTPIFLLWLPTLYAIGLYELRRLRNLYALIAESLLATVVNGGLSVILFYLLEPYYGRGRTPKTNLLLTLIFAHIGFFVWRHVWVRIINSRRLIERIAFLGDGAIIETMMSDLQARPDLGRAVDFSELARFHLVEKRGFSPFLIRGASPGGFPVDRLVVEEALIRSDSPLFRKALDLALAYGAPLMNHLDFYESLYRKIPPHYAARPDWLLPHVLSRDRQFENLIKRFLDVVGAVVGLVLLSPLLAIVVLGSIASGIRRPIYSQGRLGYLGAEFRIWKFRTMMEGADQSGPLWDIPKQDARVTGWGRFLRRLRIDELPQLWNVLKGEMSLVGPRPEWVEEVRVLEKTVPHYHLRHLVKPGISGWAQVNFRATNSPEDSLEKLQYDLYYVKNMSLALDLGILLKTVKRVCLREEYFGRARRPPVAVLPSP